MKLFKIFFSKSGIFCLIGLISLSLNAHATPKYTVAYDLGYGKGKGDGPGQMRNPEGIAHHAGKVFVSDSDLHRISVFSTDGRLLTSFGQKGKNAREFSSPAGLGVNAKGHLYVCDPGNGRIQVFDVSGDRYDFIRQFGKEILSEPFAVSVTENDRVFVADAGAVEVSEFSQDGIFLKSWARKGKTKSDLQSLSGIFVSRMGGVFVADPKQKKILVFKPEKELPDVFATGLFGPLSGLPSGEVFAYASEQNQIVIFNASGQLTHAFGSKGKGRGQFDDPKAIFATQSKPSAPSAIEVWVANAANERGDLFRIDVQPPQPELLTRFIQSRIYRGEIKKSGVISAFRFSSDDLYTADPLYGQIYREKIDPGFSREGSLSIRQRVLGYEGASKEKRGFLNSLKDFAVAESTEKSGTGKELSFFISENLNHKVHVYSRKGEEKFSFGGKGSTAGLFQSPSIIRIFNNELFVLDEGNARIQVFSFDGVFLREIKPKAIALKKPSSFVIRSDGSFLIADASVPVIAKLSSKGEDQEVLTTYGVKKQRFTEIVSLSIDENDWLYILDRTSQGHFVHILDGEFNHTMSFLADSPKEPKRLSVQVGNWVDIALYSPEEEIEAHFLVNPMPSASGFNLNSFEEVSSLDLASKEESFVEKYRLYLTSDPLTGTPVLVAEGGREAMKVKSPSQPPPYYLVLKRLSKSGLEGKASLPVRAHFLEGRYYFAQNSDAHAIESFRQAAKENARDGLALKYLALALARSGKKSEAEDVVTQLEKYPQFQGDAEIFRGEMYLQAGDYLKAEEVFRNLRLKFPDSKPVLIHLAKSLSQQGQLQRSIAVLKEALRMHPGSADLAALIGENYFESKLFQNAKESFQSATVLAPDLGEYWNLRGKAEAELAEIPAAIASYQRALSLNQNDLQAIEGLGLMFLKNKKYADLDGLLASVNDPLRAHPTVIVLQGKLLSARGKTEDAIAKLQEAIEDGVANRDLFIEVALLNRKLNAHEKSVEVLRRALKIKAADPDVLVIMGQSHLALNQTNDAQKSFDEALTFEPNHIEALEGLGDVAAQNKSWEKAQAFYQKALSFEVKPTRASFYLKYARVLLASGKNGEALTVLEEGIRLEPNQADLFFEYGRANLENGFLAKAETALKKAIALKATEGIYHFKLGQVYLKGFRFDDAISSFSQAVKSNPENVEFKQALNDATGNKKLALETNPNAPPVEILDIQLEKVFAAAYKTYAQKPLGEIKFRNNTEQRFNKVQVSMFIKSVMDFPATFSFTDVAAHQIVTVPIKATLSNRILDFSEDTDEQVQLVIKYFVGGQEKEFKDSRGIKIYGRNALVWSQKEMIGAFLTPKDPPVMTLARALEKMFKKETTGLQPELALAMKVYAGLSAMGLSYVADPNFPFSRLAQNRELIDYVQFPRDTLKQKSGDCDDLSVLYVALLESLGVRTRFIETPGHVLVLVGTSLPEARYAEISSNKDMLVFLEGKVWLPVEMTLVGGAFTPAWFKGAQLYRENIKDKTLGFIDTAKAMANYEAVNLSKPAEGSAFLPTEQNVARFLLEDIELQKQKRVEKDVAPLLARIHADDRDTEARLQLGAVYGRNKAYGLAQEQFEMILRLRPDDPKAHVNLGNVYLKQGKIEAAIKQYSQAEKYDRMDPEIKVNLAIASFQLKDMNTAREKFREAEKIDPEIGIENAYLKSVLFD